MAIIPNPPWSKLSSCQVLYNRDPEALTTMKVLNTKIVNDLVI